MPPKKRVRKVDKEEETVDVAAAKRKPKRNPVPAKGPKLSPPLPVGETLTEYSKCQWQIGGSVGKGGFGEIYTASPCGARKGGSSAQYVIKVVRKGVWQ